MSRFFPLTIASVHQETRDTIVATLAVPGELRETFAFTQGQHLTFRTQLEGEELRRSYSICSAVQDGDLRVAIKRVAGGQFSNWANDHFKPGASIEVMPPTGQFNLPLVPDAARRYLAVAAGSGITPILSIVKTTLAAEPGSSFTLLYGNRASSSVIFRDEIASLKDRYQQRLNIVHMMSREPQDVELFNGRIGAAKCEELFARWIRIADHEAAFICGPQSMMLEVSQALQAHGMAKENIKVELFAAGTPAKARAPRPATANDPRESEITVVVDGVQRSFAMAKDKESVLDAGLKNGIDIRYSCKGGVCATCRCKVLEGKVEMDANYALEDYEIARGFVLSCQAFPITDKVVLDFDQDD
ncbi:1,2-phenylacetyl-CoA epoxidase subunit PaaE [Ideonella sp. YS5]|uniref:1,2-phenylacetyl-CoA epoxidase subunit PaaE n=1 Tax=Ideonella sp. YS5 TaxID=3453714 RepID=UPI003EE96C52